MASSALSRAGELQIACSTSVWASAQSIAWAAVAPASTISSPRSRVFIGSSGKLAAFAPAQMNGS
jgi:hypothetical protein